jgi:dienelactone hydrolase
MGSGVPKLTLLLGICLAALVLAVGLGIGRQAAGLTFSRENPDQRARRLAVNWRIVLPDGAGPHPAAILLSGCDGVRDNMDYWAGRFVERGHAALILDSHTPRGLDRLESWRLVCAGLALSGSERAGDVAVALHALHEMDEIRDRIVVFGASHGGWAAMEFVAHSVSGEIPPGLTQWPAPPGELLSAVSALVLLYPYCGVLNGASEDNWRGAPPTQMILAENDTIVSTPACLERAEALRLSGATVETFVIPDVDHGFDQREKSPLSTLDFRPDQRSVAARLAGDFMDREGL